MDAVHVSIAAVNGIDYLLTWNLRHLANAIIRGKIEEAHQHSLKQKSSRRQKPGSSA